MLVFVLDSKRIPKVSYLNAVKWIIKYVSGTCEYCILFSTDSNTSIVGYSYVD